MCIWLPIPAIIIYPQSLRGFHSHAALRVKPVILADWALLWQLPAQSQHWKRTLVLSRFSLFSTPSSHKGGGWWRRHPRLMFDLQSSASSRQALPSILLSELLNSSKSMPPGPPRFEKQCSRELTNQLVWWIMPWIICPKISKAVSRLYTWDS